MHFPSTVIMLLLLLSLLPKSLSFVVEVQLAFVVYKCINCNALQCRGNYEPRFLQIVQWIAVNACMRTQTVIIRHYEDLKCCI